MKSNKDIAAGLVAGRKTENPATEPDGETSEDDDTDGLQDASRRYFEAGKAGRYKEAAAAFRDMHTICNAQSEEGEANY